MFVSTSLYAQMYTFLTYFKESVCVCVYVCVCMCEVKSRGNLLEVY